MATVKKRPLTVEEIEAAKRLKEAWKAFQDRNPGASQDWLAKQTGLGNQSLIGQYLNAQIQLNLKALLAICAVIGADAKHISPELTGMMMGEDSAGSVKTVSPSTSVNASDILRVISLFSQTSDAGRKAIIETLEETVKLFPRG